ncbi:MAG: DNA polymerase I, partial [Oscillospiraceae bacterium]|nr:DNA polymerase I [Oscillospiraceae bacterium]
MKLLVLDGNSILNRAFYGIKLLTTKDGRYTNAIHGFLSIFLSLREQYQPEGVAIAFDVKAPTFRHRLYEDYKAQRSGMPPELAQQLPVLKELLCALGLCLLEAPGWEADDILGTLAAACGEADSCLLATGDRDSLQLVSERVTVLLAATKGDRPQTTCYTPELVREEYGVAPAQLIEIKALMGDASDNIPGIAGIGRKTAQSLVAQFSSLENLFGHLDDPSLKAGVRTKLEQGRESAFLSRTLGTICCEAPVETKYEAFLPGQPDAARVTRLMAELELFALLDRLHLEQAAAASEAAQGQTASLPVREGNDLEALLAALREAGKAVFLPCFDGDILEALLFAEEDALLRVPCADAAFPAFCKGLLEDEKIKKSTVDAKRLFRCCLCGGIAVKGMVMDTALAGYLLNPNASGYAPLRLAREYALALPLANSETEQAAAVLPALVEVLEEKLRESGQLALLREVELPLARLLASMELTGILVDAQRIALFGGELEERLQELTAEIARETGLIFNINSPKQLGEVLFGKLGLRAPKKTKTGYSTSAETLEALRGEHPVIDLVLEYRTFSKLKSTYCDGLGKVIGADGRIRSTLNQTETRTGRISSSEPNLQNIPVRTALGSELRRCFIAPEGWLLLDADYSQIELRVLAAMAEEETMQRAFREGADIHTITASQVFGLPEDMVTPLMRSRAKAVNFGIIYGIGAFSLAKDIGVSFREAEQYIQGYFAHYPKIQAFRAALIEQARACGYARTLFGRRRALPELRHSQRQLREFGERVAVNMPIQGTAADIIKIAMVRVEERFAREGLRARLILQVHDELIAEAPVEEADKAAACLREEMEAAVQLSVPMEAQVHTGRDWLA